MAAADLLAARRATGGADAALIAATEKAPTLTLLAAHADLTDKETPNEAERLLAATIADVITARHGLDDALDALYSDEAAEAGTEPPTYHAALLAALAAAGASV